jgi:tetratricopeptide (TPR) repeat protein
MDKSKKMYIKALDKYNKGYIDKAIELSEESISRDIKNAAAINLKGLLYYLKGDLDAAQKLWKMNYDINKDEVSKRYLNNTEKDKKKLEIYIVALNFLKELKINESLSLLEECIGSDFNCINVNNHIALCYLRKGQYNNALEYTEKALSVDKNNSISKEIMRTLKTYGEMKKSMSKIKVATILTAVALVVIFGVVAVKLIKINNNPSIKNLIVSILSKPNEKTKKDIVKSNLNAANHKKEGSNQVKKNEIPSNKEESGSFPSDKVKGYIESKNYDAIYEEIDKWRGKDLPINDKVILSKAEYLIKNEGVNYFYDKGCSYMSSNDYNNAKTYLLKAYKTGENSYLFQHILYMTARAFYSSGDIENAIKYYSQYDQSFSNGNYEDTVLYNLTIIYKNIDRSKAKAYAKRLIQNYPQSIYNNSITKEVANN